MKTKQADCQASRRQSRQLIITLNVPESAIIKIEALDQSGQRYDVPDGELASLVGDYIVEGLHPVEETAGFPGLHDVDGDFELCDFEDEFDAELGPVVYHGVENRRLIPRDTRKLVLGHLLHQSLPNRGCWDELPPYWEIVFSMRMLLH